MGKTKTTPMMEQYHSIRARYEDCLLFYRMGDFYELFFEDALRASKILDIALTARGTHNGAPIPMCGVPVHACEAYLDRLIRQGMRVAICEQTESPEEAKKRGSNAVVAREVVRIVTPGTITEERLLEGAEPNYLAVLASASLASSSFTSSANDSHALAWADISTGELLTTPLKMETLEDWYVRTNPQELILPESMLKNEQFFDFFAQAQKVLLPLPDSRFDITNSYARVCKEFGVDSLDAFGAFTNAEIKALGVLKDYIGLTQVGASSLLRPPLRVLESCFMHIDAASQRNLELQRSLGGEKKGSLLETMNATLSAAGGRLLAHRLSAPLRAKDEIEERLDEVDFFVQNGEFCARLREILKHAPDTMRALSRLKLKRGTPRDLGIIRDTLYCAHEVVNLLKNDAENAQISPAPKGVRQKQKALKGLEALGDKLNRALCSALPPHSRDGGFIALGYHETLDALRAESKECHRQLARLEARYRKRTGVETLRIRHNHVLGYFIELPSRRAHVLGSEFIHRQNISSSARYKTREIEELAQTLSNADGKALSVEHALFEALCSDIVIAAEPVSSMAESLAGFDVASASAWLASTRNYARPELLAEPVLCLKRARHPVVEHIQGQDKEFTANDCQLGEGAFWLVTGPNMAGKSTFLRQTALIAILAQSGFFVPAEQAKIGIIDKLFCRVGASDALAQGRSTFMVEMIETAAIVNQASARSLVILDEIGRGTSTHDGLSIAWAASEHIHDKIRCRCLFATHYHELGALIEKLARAQSVHMQVREWNKDIVFLHSLGKGPARRSYGIEVAKRAGLPDSLIGRAREILDILEGGGAMESLPLFSAAMPGSVSRPVLPDESAPDESAPDESATAESPPEPENPILAELQKLEPDRFTPRQALDYLYLLADKISGGSG